MSLVMNNITKPNLKPDLMIINTLKAPLLVLDIFHLDIQVIYIIIADKNVQQVANDCAGLSPCWTVLPAICLEREALFGELSFFFFCCYCCFLSFFFFFFFARTD